MTTPEITARAGEALSSTKMTPAQEMSTALTGFITDFKDFQTSITTRLQQQEEKMTKLDRKTLTHARPVLASAASEAAPHQKAFAAYLRSGDDDALRGLELEGKAMSSSVAADGGYLVDPQTSETIQNTLSSTASLRAIAAVVTVEASSYDVLVDHGDMGAGWADETSASSETTTSQQDRISIALHELSAMPKVSQRLLDDSAFDIEGWLAGRIADKFARSEAAAFVNGDGVGKPKGFLTENTIENDLHEWGYLGTLKTGVAGDFAAANPGDILIELVYALGAEYRAGASFVMNSKTASKVRQLKGSDGRYLWNDGFAAGEPARLMGYPVLVCEDMPDIAADAAAIAFGDFGKGYTVAERPDMRVLRDPFSAKPNVLFYATKRVGGAVSDFNAIKLLSFSA